MQFVIKYELNLFYIHTRKGFRIKQFLSFRVPYQPTGLAQFITYLWSRETAVMSYTSWYPAALIHICCIYLFIYLSIVSTLFSQADDQSSKGSNPTNTKLRLK